MSSLAQIPRQSAVRYFEILEDTLLVHRVAPLSTNVRVRVIKHPRFYFFDNGILNALLRSFDAPEDRRGLLFETLVHNQLLHTSWGLREPLELSFYRTDAGSEVDFVFQWQSQWFGVEVKASRNVGPSDLRGLHSLSQHFEKPLRPLVLYLGHVAKVVEGVAVFPWQQGLKEMGF